MWPTESSKALAILYVAALICLGGLAFNIGNVGGTALGLNAALGLDVRVGYIVSGAIGIVVFLVKQASKVMDTLVKVLGGIMIVVILVVIFIVQPPVGLALKETFAPSTPVLELAPAILTLLGGTVGGYITFSGAHRLIDAGISGEENLDQIKRSSIMGIGIASIVRVFLFLAILGVVVTGVSLSGSLQPCRRCLPHWCRRAGLPLLWFGCCGLPEPPPLWAPPTPPSLS
ncbi:MAG: divalent metal cation transporter [Oscillospiraceae bacterium]